MNNPPSPSPSSPKSATVAPPEEKRNYFARFHMRQSIGLNVLYFINRFIVYGYFGVAAGDIGKVGVLVLFVLGVFGALQGKEKLVPVFGAQFQEWFKNI